MNLGKLLAAGRSVIGGRREICYRINDRNYLPKFISPKNPFVPLAPTEPPPKAIAAPVKKRIASDGTKTQKLPMLPPLGPRRSAWVGKLNPVLIWRRSRPPVPQKAQRPLQAELSLDRVKVVHNDLSDADVEIVPIKSRPALATAESVPASARDGDSWSRLSAKIFGVKAA